MIERARSSAPPVGWGIGALVLAAGCGAGDEPWPRPARVVLVSMDTVRADFVSGYGERNTTPELARIAAEGVRFENAYAASNYTIPSTMSIFTGLDPLEHGVTTADARLADDVPTLAERFSAAGWRTAAFHEGGYVGAQYGFDRGFHRWRRHDRLAVVNDGLDDVLAWMREASDEPYFLFVHTYAAHFPYGGFEDYRARNPERGLPSDAELARMRAVGARTRLKGAPVEDRITAILHNHLAERHGDFIPAGRNRFPEEFFDSATFESDIAAMQRAYAERIRQVDRALGVLRRTLEERDQWEDTLLVVLSDHGESFFEHGLSRHDYVPFDEAMKVPLVVSWPRVLDGRARVVHDLVWHLDLYPTLVRLAGLAHAGERVLERLDRRDLTGLLAGDEELDPERAVFPSALRPAHLDQEPLRRVAVTNDWKFIEGHAWYGDPDGLLFDRRTDALEERNLRADRPGVTRELEERIDDHVEGLGASRASRQADGGRPSAAELDELRALGYVDDD